MNIRILSILLLLASASFGALPLKKEIPQPAPKKPQGWSFDIGGTYTWMSVSTPPTYSGNTGGVLGKISYQVPGSFFGQARSFYNIGPLSSSLNKTSFQESYSEFVGGYCIAALKNWTITPNMRALDLIFSLMITQDMPRSLPSISTIRFTTQLLG